MGTIQIDGSTPKLTIGNATAEDATILFDGNAQDFYIALDDSADDLLIGLGSTVGTTPAIAIDENLKVNIPVIIRLAGTNAEAASELLKNSDQEFIVAQSLKDAAEKAVNVIN